jgi:hypothetical protein
VNAGRPLERDAVVLCPGRTSALVALNFRTFLILQYFFEGSLTLSAYLYSARLLLPMRRLHRN